MTSGLQMSVAAYAQVVRALGETPTYSVPELAHAPASGQAAADAQLIADGDVKLSPTTARPRGIGPPPNVQSVQGGNPTTQGACVAFAQPILTTPGSTSSVVLRVPAVGLRVIAGAAMTTVAIRRFSPTFAPPVTVAARGALLITARSQGIAAPWYVQLESSTPVRACTAGPIAGATGNS